MLSQQNQRISVRTLCNHDTHTAEEFNERERRGAVRTLAQGMTTIREQVPFLANQPHPREQPSVAQLGPDTQK